MQTESAAAQVNGDKNRVVLEGEWDLARRQELKALLDRLNADGPATIDLSGVTYCDSTALDLLARLVLRFQGTPITLLRPRPQIIRLLKLVNFDKLFTVVENEQALAVTGE